MGLATIAVGTFAFLLWVGAGSQSGATGGVESTSGIGPWGVALAWLALAVVLAIVGGLAGASYARSHWVDTVREARMERQALASLLDVWQWHTDAEHRLTRLIPPSGAPATAWSQQLGGHQTLWDRFECDTGAPTALRERVLARATISDLTVSHRDSSGARQWLLRGVPRFDAAGKFAGYVGTARPLQGTFDAHWLQPLLSAMPGAVIVGSVGADGTWRVAQVNAAARELIGADGRLSWEQMLSRMPPELATAARAAAVDAQRLEGVRTRVAGYELQLRRIDGDVALQVLSLVPTPAAVDDAAASAGDHEAFSYTVSHDLRAPIRVVEGFTRIVKEDYGRLLDKIGIDHLDRVLGAASRMNCMIDALLNLSQLSARPLASQPVNMSQLARYVVDELRRNAPERSVDVQIENDMTAQGDPTLLRVVLENLLGNAWKYTAKVGHARISMECTRQGNRVAYTVRDNGAGFDMRFADRLFGVFQRLHSASDFEGTGLGLASVLRIVRRHGGEVWAESEVNRGASFHFTLRG